MSHSFLPATVTSIVNETHNVKRFFFKVESEEPFLYKAGQFVMLNLPIDSKVKTRSYSIASAPTANNEFELCIVLKPDGLGTQFIWENVRESDTIEISRTLGKFSLPQEIDRELCFICTGTGIAPFMAMLQQMSLEGRTDIKSTLVFGCRHDRDILYKKEIEILTQQFKDLTYIPVLSRQENWQGEKGYVHGVYERLYADKRPVYFYLCGWHDMLHETRRRLEAMGYEKQYVKFEAYD